MLQVNHISKTYPGENLGAVKEVTFSVNKGEIVSIIGKSGCGKTTLLRIIAGLMRPDSGSVTLNGEPLLNPEEQLIAGHPSIKMVFQDYDLMPNMTVEENIAYMLLDYETVFKQVKIDQLLALCGLDNFRNRKPRELSGGQQQRLSLARALADEPDLLLMDEPMSNIDPISKHSLLLEIERITKELNVGVVFVSHDTKDALMISDRVGFMHKGQLLQLDSPEILYNQPKSLIIAQFLGVLNKFEFSELLEFGITNTPKGKLIGVIRAESLELCKKDGEPVEVNDCKFLGYNYLVKSLTKNGKVLYHYSQSRLEIGSRHFLNLKSTDFMYF